MSDFHDLGPRKTGRTTRIIDGLVQDFFDRGYCICRDHVPTDRMSQWVFDRVINRLSNEHKSLKFVIERQPFFIVATDREGIFKAKHIVRNLERDNGRDPRI